MSSADYWLLNQLCPACRPPACDHAHCDPDRTDCPSLLCECVSPLDIPEQRSTDG